MTEFNFNEYQSANDADNNNNNSSFILNQSNVPMDIDLDDQIITTNTTKINGHISPSFVENGNDNNENNKEDVFHLG